jgi:hypothetical protein
MSTFNPIISFGERKKAMKTRTFVAGLVLVVVLAVSSAVAQVPQMINYQGKLTKPGTCSLDTTVSMTFAIYDDSTGGSALWNETHSAVVVQEGIFNVLLGGMTLIPDSALDGSVRYLGIKVGLDSEMTPRKPIVSVGYAFRSEFSDTADYARSGAADNDWAVKSDTVYRSGGRVAIGTSHPDAKLELEGYIPGDDDATLHLDAIWNPEIFMDAGDVSADGKIHFQTEGTTKWSFVHDGSEDALKFSKTGSGNVLCLSSSARVGIGTISPAYKLDVSGDIRATGTIYGNCDNADKVDGYHAGNSSGQVALSNGTTCSNLNADKVDGIHLLVKDIYTAGSNDYFVNNSWVRVYGYGTLYSLKIENPSGSGTSIRYVYSLDFGTPVMGLLSAGQNVTFSYSGYSSIEIRVIRHNIASDYQVTLHGVNEYNGWLHANVIYND